MAQAIRKVGVVGLGNMGLPIARTLAAAGFEVKGFDTMEERRAAFSPNIGSLGDLATASDALLLSLPTSDIIEKVVAEAAESLTSGRLILDTSTAEPASSRRLQAEMAARGIGYLDAPVSGGPTAARNGQLLVMAGGAESDLNRAAAVLQAIARQVVHCGGPGTGNVTKLVNNLLCAAHLTLAGEALALAEAGDLQPEALLAALNVGSGRSGVTELNLPRWVLSNSFDSGFSMGLMRKDVGLALKLASEVGLAPRLATAAGAIWRDSGASVPDSEDFNRMVPYAKETSRR
ncbi:NAD(P)-dependent oxidoreductase [Algihabitans albus]|uniref:NAD(P)-dependent oxidoreductase n=1 Tax=Algihabitans albus TaxID=2164067 RepID=UPI0035CFBFC6